MKASSLRQMTRENKRARKRARACGGRIEKRQKRGPVGLLESPESRKLACSRRLDHVRAGSEQSRTTLGHIRTTFGARADWHGNAKVSQGLNCVAGAALSQGEVQTSWQAPDFCKVKCRFHGRGSIFAKDRFRDKAAFS